MTTQFIPPYPNPQSAAEVCANRLAAIKAGALHYRQIGSFHPVTHWSELVKEASEDV